MNTYTLTQKEWFPVRHMCDNADSWSWGKDGSAIAHYDDGRYVSVLFHDDRSVTITEGRKVELDLTFPDPPKVETIKTDLDLGFGYSSFTDWEALDLTPLELSFVSELPHGSGIDYDWNAERQINGKLRLSNAYHFMNEVGYYIGSLDFTIIVDSVDLENFRLEFNGLNSTGYAWVERLDLRSYLDDTFVWTVEKATCEHVKTTVNDYDVRMCSNCGAIVD